jgi:hypothetical protein
VRLPQPVLPRERRPERPWSDHVQLRERLSSDRVRLRLPEPTSSGPSMRRRPEHRERRLLPRALPLPLAPSPAAFFHPLAGRTRLKAWQPQC